MLPKDYINYKLTGVHCTDYSDASGMLLLDVEHKCWSKEPSIDELHLEPPEIVHQDGRCGVRLQACAPSIQMMKATIHTELSPIVGTEKQSEDLVQSLLADFADDPVQLWESNIFGKSLHELVNDGLQNKLLHIPQEARTRLQETLERVINEGCTADLYPDLGRI